jgi:hypothetical protein
MKQSMPGPIELPELGDNAIAGQLGEVLVEAAVLDLGQLYQRRTGLDFGIDGVIELVTDGKQASGRQVGVQVKRGLSVVRKTRYGRTLYCTEQHANYWLGHSLPVIVVHVEPGTEKLRWQHVTSKSLRRTENGYAIDLPEDSDLRASLGELGKLAGWSTRDVSGPGELLVVPYDPATGITMPDEDLGLALLALSRSAIRGIGCRVEIEFEGEADLVASIDAIKDTDRPTAGQRREAIVREDILSRYRKRAGVLRRVLSLLFIDPRFAEPFGYNDTLIAEAARRAAGPMYGNAASDGVLLEAWPSHRLEYPTVKFEVPDAAMEEFYARESINRVLIGMGSNGGVVVAELPHRAMVTCFLPALAHRLVTFADAIGITDAQALEATEATPNFWLLGLA